MFEYRKWGTLRFRMFIITRPFSRKGCIIQFIVSEVSNFNLTTTTIMRGKCTYQNSDVGNLTDQNKTNCVLKISRR